MKQLVTVLRFLLPLALLSSEVLAAGRTAAVAVVSTNPVIASVHQRTVKVRVPAGLDSVTLERCTSAKLAQWQIVDTLATTARGAGVLTFQLPKAVSARFLRVKGNITSTGTLAGARLFLADPSLANVGSSLLSGGVVNLGSGNLALAGSASGADSAIPRTVSESDIWRVAGNRLYFFNELRGLQVFDITNPDDPTLLGQMRGAGIGEEMYLFDNAHVILLTRSMPRFQLLAASSNVPILAGTDESAVVVADVSKGAPVLAAALAYRGSLRESRLVGSVLYVISEVWDTTASSSGQEGLEVTSFDLSNPAHPVQRASLFLGNWGGVITATDRFLFVVHYGADWQTSVIDVVDISSPTGALVKRGQVNTAGSVYDKFKMHLDGDILTTVSAVPRKWNQTPVTKDGADANASRTVVETFSLANPNAPAPLGSLELGIGETVRATRFDGPRLYVVTFFQIDPLWVVDLTPAEHPSLLGTLSVPGFSSYIQPLGDRLVAVGQVGSQAAVSLFDVSNPMHPALLSQLPLGDGYSYSEANWTEKAFNVMPDENLIVLPYSGYDATTGYASRVQLIDLQRNALVKRGVVDQGFAARRTAVKGDRLLAISSTDLVTINFTDRDHPVVTSDVEIAWRVDRVLLAGSYLLQIGGGAAGYGNDEQTLSVSTSADPDTTLAAVKLDSAPVVGAAVRDGRLYVAQYTAAPYPVYLSASGAEKSAAPQAATFSLSVFDLTKLPALTLLAQKTSPTKLSYANELAAVWPTPGVLVWVREQANYWPWIYYGGINTISVGTVSTGVAVKPMAAPAASLTTTTSGGTGVSSLTLVGGAALFAPWRWNYAQGGVEAVVFDVSDPAAPTVASELEIRTGSTGQWSEPFTANGALYVSSAAFDEIVVGDGTLDPALPVLSRRNRHFLKVVTFADPAHPVIGAEVNIPGKLIGLGSNGDRLYTAGCQFATNGTPTSGRALHASSFDGTAATFLDQIPLPDYSDTYAVNGETLLVGHGGSDAKSGLQAWQLDSAGKFQIASQQPLTGISALNVVHGLLIVSQSASREVYDLTDATHVRDLGPFPNLTPYYWSSGLNNADGAPDAGLWEPLGDYGVNFVTFSK